MTRARTARNRADYFEIAITATSLLAGGIYAFGPDRVRSAGSFIYINAMGPGTAPMQLWGALILVSALAVLVGRLLRARPTRLVRIGHAFGAGVWFFMGLATFLSLFTTSLNGATWCLQFIAAAMHFFYATDEPSLAEVSQRLQSRRP